MEAPALPVLHWFLHVFHPLGIIYFFISFPVSIITNVSICLSCDIVSLPRYLGDELSQRLSSELLNLLRVQTGQVVELSLLLGFAAAVERSVL